MLLLVRRNVGRSEINAAQLKALLSLSRQCEVPLVNGIKGSAEQRDVHGYPIVILSRLLFSCPCIS